MDGEIHPGEMHIGIHEIGKTNQNRRHAYQTMQNGNQFGHFRHLYAPRQYQTERVEIEIVTQDERFTTAFAQRVLTQAKVKGKKRKQLVDKVAAQQILQTYMDRMG